MKHHLLTLLCCLAMSFPLGCASPEGDESSAAGDLQSDDSTFDEGYGDAGIDKAISPKVLNLRVHIMRNISFRANGKGVAMTNDHLTVSTVRDTLVPEMNKIWSPAGVSWRIEKIFEEDAIQPPDFVYQKGIVENAKRDEEGHSDDTRLKPLNKFMDPKNMALSSLGKNLFHLYIFPFIGNTSQGNAMRDFGFRTVVGSWSNKSTPIDRPERRLNTESHASCNKGSLGRTMAHEVGHVLGLRHDECEGQCLMGGCGYRMTSRQISVAQARATSRMK